MIKHVEKPVVSQEQSLPAAVTVVFETNENSLAQFAGRLEHTVKTAGKESFVAFAKRSLLELTNVKFALASFVVNNLRRRYRRSVLGFAWSLLNPLLMMCVMTFVFSMLFKQGPKAFGFYVFTGLLPWSFFCDSVLNGSGSITGAESFLKKVYIPKMFFPLVTVSTEGANFVFSMTALLMLAVICGVQVPWTIVCVVPAFALLFVFSLSLAIFFAIATVYFRDLAHILRVFLSALFYTVPVIYPMSLIPDSFKPIYLLNPMGRFIDLFRLSLVDGVVPSLDAWLVPAATTAIAFCLALYTLKRTERDLIFRL